LKKALPSGAQARGMAQILFLTLLLLRSISSAATFFFFFALRDMK